MVESDEDSGLTATSVKPYAGARLKGVSGNPGGRPKGDATVKELARAHTVEAIGTLVAMLQAGSERTRVAAAEALLSRGWGTPTAHIETGPPGSFADALDAVKQRAPSDN